MHDITLKIYTGQRISYKRNPDYTSNLAVLQEKLATNAKTLDCWGWGQDPGPGWF